MQIQGMMIEEAHKRGIKDTHNFQTGKETAEFVAMKQQLKEEAEGKVERGVVKIGPIG